MPRASRSGAGAPRSGDGRTGSSGSGPACPVARRGSARRAAARSARPGPLDQPLALLLDDLSVQLDAARLAQVLDHVPVDRALVEAAGLREALADRQVHCPL